MILLIDAGNTFMKWALVSGDEQLHSGIFPIKQAGELSDLVSSRCGRPKTYFKDIQQIWVSNVAGDEIARQIRTIKFVQPDQFYFINAKETQCGVKNCYTKVDQLGSDRWASLIAAWHLVRGKCLVVNSGTATTIDTLSEQGEFLGGLIVPGVELMQSSLSETAVQLKSANAPEGLSKSRLISGQVEFVPLPKNTADAMFSGAVQATCGAIERQYALFDDKTVPVVLSGGAVGVLQKNLNLPTNVVDNLVLQGLLLIAQEMGV